MPGTKIDIVGMGEICDMAKVSGPTVWNWKNRYKDFPKPLVVLAMGPIFNRQDVLTWLKERKNGLTGSRRIKISSKARVGR